jgi:hypothetical protein
MSKGVAVPAVNQITGWTEKLGHDRNIWVKYTAAKSAESR